MPYMAEGSKITAQRAYSWFKDGRDHLSKAMKDADTCCQYYDNEQWTKEEILELEDREQPILTKNHIKPTVDLVLGTETKVRVDYKAFPRSGAHVEDAEVVTHLLKHVMDQCKGEYVLSKAFEGMIKPGWAVVEVYKDFDPFKEPCRIRIVPRDQFVWDKFSREWDWDDARFVMRWKWMDLEDAIALYPEFKNDLQAAVNEDLEHGVKQPYEMTGDETDPHGSVFDWDDDHIKVDDWINKSRSRVRILEVWYKVPVKVYILENLQTGEKQEINLTPIKPELLQMLMSEDVKVYQATIKKVRLAMVAGPNVLEDNWSPYRHNRFPFVPFWGFLRDRDGTPYSLIMQMLSPQDEINKRSSKALHILNAAQVITDESDDERVEEYRKEAAKPDGVLRIRGSSNRFEINRETQLAQAQFEMYKDAINEINLVSGVNPDLMAQQTNAQSGIAMQTRIVQGNTLLAGPFDSYRRSRQLVGELLFANIQQYYTVPKTIRIVDQGNVGFVTINQKVQDDQGTPGVANDITRARVDIKIDEEAYQSSVREAMFETVMDLVGKLSATMPMVALALLDLVVSYSDVPGRNEMVNRIRQIQAQAGMVSPESEATQTAV